MMRKKIFRILIAVCLISLMLVAPAYAESATVTGSVVNFRSGPGTGFAPITSLERGTVVTVTNRSDSAWYGVSYGGYDGYISSAYLRVNEDAAVNPQPGIYPDEYNSDYYVNQYVSFTTPQPFSDGSQGGGQASVIPAPQVTPGAAAPQSGETKGYINAMYVRFRSGPSSGYSVLGEYNKGKEVSVIDNSGQWTSCVIDGQFGYVFSQYISVNSANEGSVSAPQASAVIIPSIETAAPDNTPQASVPSPETVIIPNGQSTVQPSPSPDATLAPTPSATPEPTPLSIPSPEPEVDLSSLKAYDGRIVGTYVRFRTGPGTNYSIITSYNSGKQLKAYRNDNGWLLCQIDGLNGYVSQNYVYLEMPKTSTPAQAQVQQQAAAELNVPIEPTPTPTPASESQNTGGYITGNNVRLRNGPSMSSGIISELFYGNVVNIKGRSGDWAQVEYNGNAGYVFGTYVKEGKSETLPAAKPETAQKAPDNTQTQQAAQVLTGGGQDVANYALQFLNYPYVWGGTSPATGFDCSGLVQYVYKQFGYNLNRVAADQARNGVHVDAGSLQAGDILCFYTSGSYIGHVGIYLGNGNFIHASGSTTGVIISPLSGSYVTRGFEARRIIN